MSKKNIIPGIPKFGEPKHTSSDLNELRLVANEIMHKLYEAGETDQLRILRSYAATAIEYLEAKKKTS